MSTGLVLAMGSMIALAPLTVDTYLPALPSIQHDLRTTPGAVQLTLTGTLLGLALGQVIIGPLSDLLGRRRPLLAGAALHVVASLLIALAPSIAALGALRVLQGFGAAAATVVTTAMVRDVAAGNAAATVMARLMLVMGVAPVLAPTLGSQVLRFSSWRGVFVMLAGIGLVLLGLAVAYLPETLPPAARRSGGVLATVRGYGTLLRDSRYLGLVLVTGLTMGALFAYVAGSSYVMQGQYGLDQQQFALVFAGGAIALIGASQLSPLLLRRFELAQLLLGALVLGTVAGALVVAAAVTGFAGLPGLLVPIWLALAAGGIALPNSPALALSRHPGDVAGSAAAVLGAAQFGIAALIPPLVGLLGVDAIAMAALILASMALGLAVLVLVVRPWSLSLDAPDTGTQAAPVPRRSGGSPTAVPADA